ncbi:MAG: prepilin-type N-terminal cleavage/methylation domain-containing protein [bacterium]|nr:prepilin-type N-terminal cleavage/methylation domain-containing protein [bacterium]
MGNSPDNDRRRLNRCGCGFSLLELVVVVAIMAIFAAVVTPRYGQAIARYRTAAAARKVATDLTFARRRAKISSTSQAVNFNIANDAYQLPGVADMRTSATDYSVALSSSPYQAKIVSADFDGNAAVTFDGYGVPDSGGTVVVSVGSYSKTILLDADSGKAEVQE